MIHLLIHELATTLEDYSHFIPYTEDKTIKIKDTYFKETGREMDYDRNLMMKVEGIIGG